SLAAELRALRARLDSLRAALTRQPGAAPARAAKDSGARDELAALRAAAAGAAGTETLRGRADTSGQTRFVGRERNQAQLNPEISVTGDVRAYGTTTGIQRDNFDPREFEIGFQSALDPYSHTKIFVSLEGGEVSVEEGYAYWTGLPGHIRFDIGNFRQLSPSTYMQIGGTGLYGTDPDSALRTRVGGLEFRLTWRPPARTLYRDWTLRGELLALKRQYGGVGPTRLGGYVSTTYKLG